MKKIVITGALGHIGSGFVHQLKPKTFDSVVLIDNLYTQRYCSLFNLPEGVPFKFVERDICKDHLEEYFEGTDAVIHLAAITDAPKSFEIAEKVDKVNFEGTKKVARACLQSGSKLVFLSTTSVYGTQTNLVDENCSKTELKPQSPYAASKLKAEKLLQEMNLNSNLKCIIFRFGTIFGVSPGMRFHTAVNKFVWQAVLGLPLTVWRTALNQKRPYLDLSDGIKAINFALENDIFDGEVYNVVTANATVQEIIDVIKSFVPDVKVQLVEEKIMNQLSYEVSAEKFKKLGFRFDGDFKKSIKETFQLLKNCGSFKKLSAT